MKKAIRILMLLTVVTMLAGMFAACSGKTGSIKGNYYANGYLWIFDGKGGGKIIDNDWGEDGNMVLNEDHKFSFSYSFSGDVLTVTVKSEKAAAEEESGKFQSIKEGFIIYPIGIDNSISEEGILFMRVDDPSSFNRDMYADLWDRYFED